MYMKKPYFLIIRPIKFFVFLNILLNINNYLKKCKCSILLIIFVVELNRGKNEKNTFINNSLFTLTIIKLW